MTSPKSSLGLASSTNRRHHPSIETFLAALSILHELLPTPLRYLATIVKRVVVKMASSTKYQPAPQSDPDDYTHAPPAYAEGSSSRDETQGLFGAPRNSEDNLPDDFKVRYISAKLQS